MRTTLVPLIVFFSVFGAYGRQETARYLPDPGLTPGDVLDVSKAVLCESGYKSPARDLPVGLKGQVLDRYGISPNVTGYNIDRLIPVDLGGSNSIRNLWPQPLAGEWNHQMKNRLERRLKKMVCAGQLELKDAQREIAVDWIRAYKKYVVKAQ